MLLEGMAEAGGRHQVVDRLIREVFLCEGKGEGSSLEGCMKVSHLPSLLDDHLARGMSHSPPTLSSAHPYVATARRASILKEERVGRIGPAHVKVKNPSLPSGAGYNEPFEVSMISSFSWSLTLSSSLSADPTLPASVRTLACLRGNGCLR